MLVQACMLVLLGISLILALLLRSQAPLASAPLIDRVHQLCIDACPQSIHREFLNAIVCGEPLAGGSSITLFKSDFIKTGLIHLLVVSGSHLICLEEIAARFRITSVPRFFRGAAVFCTLLVFTLMTSASPPVLRSMIQWCLRRLSAREGWNWTRTQLLTITGSITLIFCKDNLALSSLFLSWIAALGLGWVSSNWRLSIAQKTWASLKTNAGVYLTLCPALLPLGIPHPLSILCNCLFAPAMGLLLFPISIAGFLWSGFGGLATGAWTCALWLVSRTAQQVPYALSKFAISQTALVPYIGALTIWFCYARGQRQRKRIGRKLAKHLVVIISMWTILPLAARADELIVWNVGQGSWATLVTPSTCMHFDVGGEHAPLKSIRAVCGDKANQAYFSHWDWDHIQQTTAAHKLMPNLCIEAHPGGQTESKMKLQMLAAAPNCVATEQLSETVPDIFTSRLINSNVGVNTRRTTGANESSRVYVLRKIIFPGDSPSSAEKIWDRSALVMNATVLVAGHHGSKTSTSLDLLNRARKLKMIIVSARKQRYGHPHPAMLARARAVLLPVLTTEDWGSLHIELSAKSGGPR